MRWATGKARSLRVAWWVDGICSVVASAERRQRWSLMSAAGCQTGMPVLCHLGRQRQHSAVICSGALLFSSRVLRPSLVTLCSHKSGRCEVELYHASHLWYLPFYTSPMASSALQHWTTSSTKEGCHWQAGGENRQTWQLANPAWYP